MKIPTVKLEKDVVRGAIIVCVFFLVVTIPILASSYSKKAEDMAMYEFYDCKHLIIHQTIEPDWKEMGNETLKTTCARLKLDPKIVIFKKPADVLVGLYPFIILAGLLLGYLGYHAAMEGF